VISIVFPQPGLQGVPGMQNTAEELSLLQQQLNYNMNWSNRNDKSSSFREPGIETAQPRERSRIRGRHTDRERVKSQALSTRRLLQ